MAGDGGLPNAAMMLSIAASTKRRRISPWTYVRRLLTTLPLRAAGADLTDLLPDIWAKNNLHSRRSPNCHRTPIGHHVP